MSASTVTLRPAALRDREFLLELAKGPVPERLVGRVDSTVLIDPIFETVFHGLPGTFVVDTIMEGSLAIAAVLPAQTTPHGIDPEGVSAEAGIAQLIIVGHRQWCGTSTWKAIVRACVDHLAELPYSVVVADVTDRGTRKTLTHCGFQPIADSDSYLTWTAAAHPTTALTGQVLDTQTTSDADSRLRVVTGMPLSERAQAVLAEELGQECDIVDIRQAGNHADVVLVPPLSGMALGSIRAMFPGARVIYTEVADLDGRGFSGPVTRALHSGADGYLVAPDLAGLAANFHELENQLAAGQQTPLILPSAANTPVPPALGKPCNADTLPPAG